MATDVRGRRIDHTKAAHRDIVRSPATGKDATDQKCQEDEELHLLVHIAKVFRN